MTKPTLKERLEKKWLGRRVRTVRGSVGTVISIISEAETNVCPVRVELTNGEKYYFPTHQLTLLKPKQKHNIVSYEELAKFWDNHVAPNSSMLQRSVTSGSFQSLCDLLGVKKNG